MRGKPSSSFRDLYHNRGNDEYSMLTLLQVNANSDRDARKKSACDRKKQLELGLKTWIPIVAYA